MHSPCRTGISAFVKGCIHSTPSCPCIPQFIPGRNLPSCIVYASVSSCLHHHLSISRSSSPSTHLKHPLAAVGVLSRAEASSWLFPCAHNTTNRPGPHQIGIASPQFGRHPTCLPLQGSRSATVFVKVCNTPTNLGACYPVSPVYS